MKKLLLVLLLALSIHAKPYTKNVAIVVYNGVEILDFAGPAEVFASAANQGRFNSERAFNVYLVSKTRQPIVSQGFIDVTPDYSIDEAPKPDIVVFPGGGAESVIEDKAWMDWVRTSTTNAEQVLTVCTGAFIAGKAGLLEGADVTTWYAAVPELAKQFPNARVIPGRRFVDNGKIITTAGVSAGIDGSLHVVAKLLGRYVADRTAEYMEYKWSPESYHSTRYATLNPQLDDRGRSLQQASILDRENNADAAIAIYRALLAANREDAEASLQLGLALGRLKRRPEAITALQAATKGDSQRARAFYNLSCLYALAGETDRAIDAASNAIDNGFKLKWYFANDEDLASVRSDPRFQALLAKLE